MCMPNCMHKNLCLAPKCMLNQWLLVTLVTFTFEVLSRTPTELRWADWVPKWPISTSPIEGSLLVGQFSPLLPSPRPVGTSTLMFLVSSALSLWGPSHQAWIIHTNIWANCYKWKVGPNQQRTLNKLATELQCRNLVNMHRLSYKSVPNMQKRVCNVHTYIPTELPFCIPPLVVGKGGLAS